MKQICAYKNSARKISDFANSPSKTSDSQSKTSDSQSKTPDSPSKSSDSQSKTSDLPSKSSEFSNAPSKFLADMTQLLEAIKQQSGLRAPELAENLNAPLKNVARLIRQLREAGKIEFKGSPKTGGYYAKISAKPSGESP